MPKAFTFDQRFSALTPSRTASAPLQVQLQPALIVVASAVGAGACVPLRRTCKERKCFGLQLRFAIIVFCMILVAAMLLLTPLRRHPVPPQKSMV